MPHIHDAYSCREFSIDSKRAILHYPAMTQQLSVFSFSFFSFFFFGRTCDRKVDTVV